MCQNRECKKNKGTPHKKERLFFVGEGAHNKVVVINEFQQHASIESSSFSASTLRVLRRTLTPPSTYFFFNSNLDRSPSTTRSSPDARR